MRFIYILFSVGLTLISFNGYAQFTISGRILNQADKKPVANASVFLSNATIGANTDAGGAFILRAVKPGNYRLIVSIIGFEMYDRDIVINNSNIILPDISLLVKTTALTEVKIKSGHKRYKDGDWQYETFKKEFLGTSELANKCKILNPEILNLDYDETTNLLTASSDDFLEIENDALGYKIKYLLTDFELDNENPAAKQIHYEGSVLFSEMKGTSVQERQWQQKREEVYEGSAMHFLRSILNDRADEEGFRVLRLATYTNPKRPPDSLIEAKIKRFKETQYYKNTAIGDKYTTIADSLSFWKKQSKLPKTLQTLFPFPLNKEDIIENTDQSSVSAMGCSTDELLVIYNKDHNFPLASQLADFNNLNYNLNKPNNKELTLMDIEVPYTFFDTNGWIINPNSLELKGAWMRNRIAQLLPVDYEAPQNKNIIAANLLENDTLLSNAIAKINSYSAAHPVEKVYLHLDRPYYYSGDTIWFKAYTVIGEHHQLSALSGVLYCELINARDSVVARHVLKLTAGIAWGDFTIARSNKPGNYHLRAYTNWMRNAGPGYFFNQSVHIVGPQADLMSNVQVAKSSKPDIQFFPEGGELVGGLRSRVAVKVVNPAGMGEDMQGVVTDNDGAEVAAFTSQHLGMGVFALTPQPGKTYKAKITTADSATYTVDLPAVRDEGFTLTVNNSGADSIFIKVAANDKLFQASQNATFYLVAQSGGKVYFTTGSKLTAPVFATRVDKARFPTGIVQVTLFSQSGEPLNERILFVQNNDEMNLRLSSASETYSPRQKVKIDLDAAGDSSHSVTGTFSVAVINESRVPGTGDAENTILSNLLLTSDLKGYIEQPNYYFEDINGQKRADLDLLMLTQGYRRFEWQRVLDNTPQTVAYKPETDLELEGTLKTPSGTPLPKGKVTLVSTRDGLITDTTTDVNGIFRFTGLHLSDTAKIVLRARKEHDGSNVNIYVKQPDYPAVIKSNRNYTALFPQLTPEMFKNIMAYQQQQKQDSLKNGRQLKEVIINGKRAAKPDIYNRYGTKIERFIDMKQLRGYPSLEMALRAQPILINQIEIIKRDSRYYQDKIDSIPVILDGLFVRETDLRAFKPNEVESVRLIDGPLLVVTTRHGAHTDTTQLKEVTIRARRTSKPDAFNNYGTTLEYDVDMKKFNKEYIRVSDGIKFMIPGLIYVFINGVGVYKYDHDIRPVQLFIDGFTQSQKAVDNYSPEEVDNIRMVFPTNLLPPQLIITSKNYAGTDTVSSIKLRQVNIQAKKANPKPDLSGSSNLHGGGNADQVIMGDNLGPCVNISDCLIGKINGVIFNSSGAPVNTRPHSGAMSIIIDGITLPGASLNDINSNDIYSIEVLRSGAARSIYGSSIGPGGALVITTRRGADPKYVTSTVPAGLITYPFTGYHIARVFYSPKYDHPKTEGEPFDSRTTIYWNPNIITKVGKASFEYYNADTKGTYRVVVEGVDENGKLGRAVYRYKVE